MAATWVSKIGCGIFLAMCQTISMSWRAAWNTLTTFSSVIRVEERREIDAGRQRVDHDGLVGLGHLRHAEQRVIGGLAQELGVDGDEGMARHALAGRGQFLGGGDRLHGAAGNLTRSGPCHGNHDLTFPRTRGMWMNSQGEGIGPTGTSIRVGSRRGEGAPRAPRRSSCGRARAPAGGAEAFGELDEIRIGEVAGDQPVAEVLLLDAAHIAEGAVVEHDRHQRNAVAHRGRHLVAR